MGIRNSYFMRVMTLFLVLLFASTPLAFAGGGGLGNNTGSSTVVAGNSVNGLTSETYARLSVIMSSDTTGKYKSVNAEDSGAKLDLFKADSSSFKFLNDSFELSSSKSRSKAVKEFTKAVNEDESISAAEKQILFSQLADINPKVNVIVLSAVGDATKADVFAGLRVTGPVMSFVQIILGVLTVAAIAFLVLSTVVDLLYIGLPFARDFGNDKNGGQGAGGGGGTKIPFVSMEAISVCKELEANVGGSGGSGGGYKNAYGLYFKRRAVSYVILSVCIMYLVMGQIGGIITFLLNLTSGLF